MCNENLFIDPPITASNKKMCPKTQFIEVEEDVGSIQVVVHLFQHQGNLEEATNKKS